MDTKNIQELSLVSTMALLSQNIQIEGLRQNQALMHRLHEVYDSRINMLLQQKRAIVQVIQHLMYQQIQSLTKPVPSQRDAGISIDRQVLQHSSVAWLPY